MKPSFMTFLYPKLRYLKPSVATLLALLAAVTVWAGPTTLRSASTKR